MLQPMQNTNWITRCSVLLRATSSIAPLNTATTYHLGPMALQAHLNAWRLARPKCAEDHWGTARRCDALSLDRHRKHREAAEVTFELHHRNRTLGRGEGSDRHRSARRVEEPQLVDSIRREVRQIRDDQSRSLARGIDHVPATG